MKILHIWNTAGVGSTIAKFMDRYYNTKSFVINRKALDVFNQNLYGERLDCGATMFVLCAILRSRKYDIVHIHGLDKIIPFIRKPIVLHYHGSEIRDKWREHEKYWKKADAIIYATPDLVTEDTPKSAVYLPTIVDTDIFYSLPFAHIQNTGICFNKNLDVEHAESYAKRHNIKLTVQNIGIPHNTVPKLFNQYEYYFDMKTTGYPLSKSGLEALACGLKVVNNKEEIIVGLPEQHRPENVCKKLISIYREVKK